MPRTSFLQAGLLALSALALFAARPAAAQSSVQYQNLIPAGTEGFFQGSGISSTGKTYAVANYNPSTQLLNTYIVSNGVATSFALPNISGLPGDAYAYIAGINDSGTAAGWVRNIAGDQFGNFLYSGGKFITPVPMNATLGARYTGVSSDGKVTTSYTDTSGLVHGALYDIASGTFTDIPNVVAGQNIDATAISSTGVVLGHYRDSNNVKHGYTYSNYTYSNGAYINGTYTYLPDVPDIPNPPGAFNFEFTGINANGLIFGHYGLANGEFDSFLYNGSYTFLSYPGAAQTDGGWGVSDNNQVIGSYYPTASSLPGAYLATVPEPGSIALLVGLSVAGAGFLRRHIRKIRAC